ncbi:MAG: hypothetical protein RRC07_10760 [Anaerolineae bacterium]|nr:hypothetical protein [Anaerolineae bacterium]
MKIRWQWLLLAVAILLAGAGLVAWAGFAAVTSLEPDPTALPQPAHPPLEPTYAALIAERRSAEVPALPFADNPDPALCGIPTPWGNDNQAWLDGRYEGEMVQPVVFLYDSHLRLDVTARATHGSEVEVLLYQQNPVTDYYLVKIKGAGTESEGWVPGPFLSFEPVPTP